MDERGRLTALHNEVDYFTKGSSEKGKNRKGMGKEENCDAVLLRDHVGPRDRETAFISETHLSSISNI